MISSENIPANRESSDADFIMDAYRELLVLAKEKYIFANYDNIPWGKRFILWRHDCDYSLNRAFELACIEADFNIQATYFLNPHCTFYNLFELGQCRIVREIIRMGHQIGLHFDAAFYDTADEECLSMRVRTEADLLESLFGTRPVAFSFHNPLAAHLHCEKESYGGLVNCYSWRFKTEVPYCSDSNGYWRFRRLRDVLECGSDPCLQVLTHPGWWQGSIIPPRQRIFRSAYGRARAVIADYDALISAHDRENLAGGASALTFLRDLLPEGYTLLDYLWMSGEMTSLFIELWRLHERQINKLCKAVIRRVWLVPAREVNTFFEDPELAIDGRHLFDGVFGQSWQEAVGVDAAIAHAGWRGLHNQLVHARDTAPRQRLEEGCVFLCGIIATLAAWGKAQPINYDGLAQLDSIGLSTYKTADGNLTDRLEEVAEDIQSFPGKRWEQFKSEMRKAGAEALTPEQ